MGSYGEIKKSGRPDLVFEMELVMGFEPATCGLRYRCSTVELHQLENINNF